MNQKIKKHDYVKLRVTHGVERAQVVRIDRSTGTLTLDRPDGRRISAWLWDDGIAHLSPQPACSDCGKLFHTSRAIDSHRHACPKKAVAAAKVAVAKFDAATGLPPRPFATSEPPLRPLAARDLAWRQQEQMVGEIKRLERALGESIEAAERGPHRSFCMRGPGDMIGDWYLFIGALWDPRDGLQVIVRRNQDKLCRTVHYSWLLPEPGVK